jgi:hypothetical protein
MKLNYRPFTVCSVTGCHLLTRSLPYCKFHAYKDKRYGDPLYVKPRKIKKVK